MTTQHNQVNMLGHTQAITRDLMPRFINTSLQHHANRRRCWHFFMVDVLRGERTGYATRMVLEMSEGRTLGEIISTIEAHFVYF